MKKLIAITTAIAIFASIPLSVAAKPGNSKSDNSKKVEVNVEVKVVEKDKTVAPEVKKAEDKKDVKEVKVTPTPKLTPKPTPKVTKKDTKPSNTKKPQVKNGVLNQLTSIEKKLTSIETDANKISTSIKLYINKSTTPSAVTTTGTSVTTTGTAVTTTDSAITTGTAVTTTPTAIDTTTSAAISTTAAAIDTTSGAAISTTPAAIETTSGSAVTTTETAINTTGGAVTTTSGPAIGTTTGSAIEVKEISKTGFINGTKGKLNALTHRLAEVEKSLKAIQKKVDKSSTAKYTSLVSRLSDVKAKIAKEIGILKGLSVKK